MSNNTLSAFHMEVSDPKKNVDHMTMTSREIAELAEKRHDNVMTDIRKMLAELHGEGGVLNFQDTQVNHQNGQSYPIFKLPKRETLILVSGYNVAMRAKIIDRWQELEAGAKPALDLRNHGQLAIIASQLVEIVQEQQAQLTAQAPKVAFAEAVGAAENTQTISETAKVLGIGPRKLFAYLRETGILMLNDLPFQAHLDCGRFRVVEVPYTDMTNGAKRMKLQTRVTGKGVTFLQQRLAKSLEVSHV